MQAGSGGFGLNFNVNVVNIRYESLFPVANIGKIFVIMNF